MYKQIQLHWQGTVGKAIRTLLSLSDTSGAYLWFSDTIKNNYDNANTLNVGVVAKQMLEYKLAEWAE